MPVTLVFAMMQMPLLTKYALDPRASTEVVPPMDPLP